MALRLKTIECDESGQAYVRCKNPDGSLRAEMVLTSRTPSKNILNPDIICQFNFIRDEQVVKAKGLEYDVLVTTHGMKYLKVWYDHEEF